MNASPTLLAGRYRVVAPLGGSDISMTFLAVDAHTGGEVVLKRFAVRNAQGWKQVELAEREAHVLRGLDHELLPRYLDHFEEDGALFTIMTRLPGEDLRSARLRGMRFTAVEAFRLLYDASSIFEYLHGRMPPIIHRDIKPANVLICPDRRFRLVDFGSVAQALRADGTTVVGTFGYMAPEQFQGRAGPASDIYGLGATILTSLTGVEPERQPHRGLAIDVLQALGPSAHPQLCRVLQSMLQPNPDDRASSLRQLLTPSSSSSLAAAPSPHRQLQGAPLPGGPRENDFFVYTITGMGVLLVAILSLVWLGPGAPWALIMVPVAPALMVALRLCLRGFAKQVTAPASVPVLKAAPDPGQRRERHRQRKR